MPGRRAARNFPAVARSCVWSVRGRGRAGLGDGRVEDLEPVARARRRGAPLLRVALPLLDPRSESPWESMMRVLHHAAEIEVEPQRNFFDEGGSSSLVPDLWVVGTSRTHEYDGAGHRDPATHRTDLRRDRALLEIGVQRFSYTAADLIHSGGSLIAATDRALGRAWDPARLRRWNALVDESLLGASGRARVPARWSENRRLESCPPRGG